MSLLLIHIVCSLPAATLAAACISPLAAHESVCKVDRSKRRPFNDHEDVGRQYRSVLDAYDRRYARTHRIFASD